MAYIDQLEVGGPLTAFGQVDVAQESMVEYVSFHYNVNTEAVTTVTANGGTVTAANSEGILQTSTATNGSALFQSRYPVRYVAGQGVSAKFSALFPTGTASSIQEVGYGNLVDGLFIANNGATFSINRRRAGSDNYTSSFSHGLPVGFDRTMWNVYRILFQWLGAGQIAFQVENKATGKFETFHVIQYANTYTALSFLNPSLPLWARNANTGNNTNLTFKIGNMGAYVSGPLVTAGIPGAYRAALAYTTAGEKVVLGIENQATVFGGAANNNRSNMRANLLTIAADGTKSAIIRMYRCTISGGSSGAIDANTSLAKYYTGTPTLANQKLLVSFELGKTQSDVVDLEKYNFRIGPGEAWVWTAESSASSDVAVSASWNELQ